MRKTDIKLSLRSQISHELITPLSSLITLIDILKDTPINNEQRDCIDDIQESAISLLSAHKKIDELVSQH